MPSSASEHNGALGPEQKCPRPGLWHIEGYEVSHPYQHTWEVRRGFRCGQVLFLGTSLRQCQDWIADQGGDQ